MAKRLVSYPISLAVVVALLVTITGGWIAWWNYRSGLTTARELAHERFEQIAHQTAETTTAFLGKAPPAAEALRNLAATEPAQLIAVLRANPSFTWVSYSDANGSFTGAYYPKPGAPVRLNRSTIADGKTHLVEHDVGADGALTLVKDVADTKYDPRTRPFYTLAAASFAGAGTWTAPYVFFEKVPGITYALPRIIEGKLVGVYTVDFDLGRLNELAARLAPSARGRVVILDPAHDAVLAHPKLAVTTGTGDKLALAAPKQLADPALHALLEGRGLRGGEGKGVGQAKSGGRDTSTDAGIGAHTLDVADEAYLASSGSIAVPGGAAWRVVVFAPERDFTAVVEGRVVTSLLISLAAVIVAVIVAWLLARRVSGPLTALAEDMARVGEFRIDDTTVRRRSLFREIELMNQALAKMKGGLRSFGKFVPRDLVRSVLASGHEATLAGEVRELTVYFADIAGFTTIAESMKPDELVQFLGTYFHDTSAIIAEESGTVDKYLGDGVMAFWGAPAEVKDHAARACVAALRCHRRVGELAPRVSSLEPGSSSNITRSLEPGSSSNITRSLEPGSSSNITRSLEPGSSSNIIRARIGIATGDVLVGTIGSPDRMNYTVMGDTANLASRLEGLNKQYGTELMIAESTYELAKKTIVARPIDVVAVKGKKRGVRVYELLALASDNDARAVELAAIATRAIDAYMAKDFTGAMDAWDEILEKWPGDKPATIMRERAAEFMQAPERWSGMTIATEK